MSKLINYVTNIPLDMVSGGYSAKSAAVHALLKRSFEVNFVGPIDPPSFKIQKIGSKLLRTIGLPGRFHFFCEERLDAISRAYMAQASEDASLDFFHGFTPWVETLSERPFVAWNDCTFHDYIRIFHRIEEFSSRDIDRIEKREAAWLSRAQVVIFRSHWAARRAMQHYGFDPARIATVPNFGAVAPPVSDGFENDPVFLFISTDFVGKGGLNVLDAFEGVRQKHERAELVVIGDSPVVRRELPGVSWLGFLKKNCPDDLGRFREALSKAAALVHPTKKDINPAVVIEAGYFGCPAIAPDTFAIPEYVRNGETGLLVDEADDVDQLSRHMCWMLENPREYARMRIAARELAITEFSVEAFGDKLMSIVRGAVG